MLECRHEWWAIEIAGLSPDAYEGMARYITDLEDQPTVDDFLDDLGVGKILLPSEVEQWVEEAREIGADQGTTDEQVGARLLAWLEEATNARPVH